MYSKKAVGPVSFLAFLSNLASMSAMVVCAVDKLGSLLLCWVVITGWVLVLLVLQLPTPHTAWVCVHSCRSLAGLCCAVLCCAVLCCAVLNTRSCVCVVEVCAVIPVKKGPAVHMLVQNAACWLTDWVCAVACLGSAICSA